MGKKKDKAKKMAEKGKSPEKIAAKTGLSISKATNISKKSSGSSKKSSGSSGIRKAIEKAGADVTRKETKRTLKAAGGNVRKAVNRLSKFGGTLRASANNLLIKRGLEQMQDPRFSSYEKGVFGTSKFGKLLQSRAGTPGSPGYLKQGQMVGGTEGTPGVGMFEKGARVDPRTGRVGYKPIGGGGATTPEAVEAVDEGPGSITVGGTGGGGPLLPEEEKPMLGTGTGGAALGEGALGIRRKQRKDLARLLGIGTKQFNRAYQRMQINLGQ